MKDHAKAIQFMREYIAEDVDWQTPKHGEIVTQMMENVFNPMLGRLLREGRDSTVLFPDMEQDSYPEFDLMMCKLQECYHLMRVLHTKDHRALQNIYQFNLMTNKLWHDCFQIDTAKKVAHRELAERAKSIETPPRET